MAIGDAYATPGQYRALKSKLSSDDDVLLTRMLAAVSRLIDLKTNNPYGYNKDDTVTTRVYRGDEETIPIATTTGLIVKASMSALPITWGDVTALVLDTDFEMVPLAPMSGYPYTGLRLIGWTSQPPSVFTPKTYEPENYRVQVTAIHGWPSVPEAVWWATIELTSMLAGESIFTTNRVQELDQAIEASPQARALLRDLIRTLNRTPIGIG